MYALSVLLSLLLAAPACAAGKPEPIALSSAVDGMEEVGIPSHGGKLNALIYLASVKKEPRPVIVFLHGYPGNERNLDLAQAVRRAGYNAVYFDFRGSWGTGGTFSFQNGLDDVAAVLNWIREPEIAAKYGFEASRITLVGHSFGGWLALMSAASQPDNVCIVSLAGWNVGWAAGRFADNPKERDESLEYFQLTTDPESGPIDAKADDLLAEMSAHAADWDYLKQTAALKSHALLLVGATNDSPDEDAVMSKSLAAAVKKAGGRRVHVKTFEDDHPFSQSRDALEATLLKWLKTDCAAQQQAAPHAGRH